MTDSEKDKIVERVQKMLRLGANQGATEGERDNALRMARKTMLKHNLSPQDVEDHSPRAADEQRVIHKAVFYGRPWARAVAASAARLCFCAYLYVGAKRGDDTKHIFVGRLSNAVTAAELAKYLVDSIDKEASRHQRQHYLNNEGYRAFAWGAASAVRTRVEDLVKAGEVDAGAGKALVLYQGNEDRDNRALVATSFPKLNRGRGGLGFSDVSSAMAGKAYGSTLSLNRQVGSSTSTRRIEKE